MKSVKLLVVLAVLLAGCGVHNTIKTNEKLSAAQVEYLKAATAQPLSFELPKAKSEEAFGRASEFLVNYSSMKLQIATDFVLQTFNPALGAANMGRLDSGTASYGYGVSRRPVGDKVLFKVECFSLSHAMYQKQIDASSARNAHILAYFIATGKLDHPELILR